MANTSLLRRGNTWFVRLKVPQERWADAGKTMRAKGGVKREIVRPLQTADYRKAQKRRDQALAQIRSELTSSRDCEMPPRMPSIWALKRS